MYKRKLCEGLRSGDLKNYVNDSFNVDKFSSKMGNDEDVVVLSFNVKEKYPAIDLVEFIEKGYEFILDADMSAGEEQNGQYQVFVEIERTPALTEQISELLGGISQLTDIDNWSFRYQKTTDKLPYTEETARKYIPITPEKYKEKVVEIKESDIKNFFDKGSVEIKLLEDNTLMFSKPYSETLKVKFLAIGETDLVNNKFPGALSLDESSQSEVFFLTKYLGNYEIDKIGNKFIITNDNQSIVIEKDSW